MGIGAKDSSHIFKSLHLTGIHSFHGNNSLTMDITKGIQSANGDNSQHTLKKECNFFFL